MRTFGTNQNFQVNSLESKNREDNKRVNVIVDDILFWCPVWPLTWINWWLW